MKKIVIILPTYNEKENILEMTEKLNQVQKSLKGWELEAIFSDSHSQDGTGEEVSLIKKKYPFINLLDVKERGIGIGLVLGYRYAFEKLKANAVIQMDADLQHDPFDIPKFIAKLDLGCDFIQGSRFIKGGGNRIPFYRQFFSWGANFLSKFIMGIWHMTEFTSSYRGFTKELFNRIDIESTPWKEKSFIFQPSFTYAVSLVAKNMAEVPIIFTDRRKGYSKMQIIQYIKDLLLFALNVRLQKSKKFFKFLTVGGLGFAINSSFLFLFTEKFHFYPVISNLISAEMAIISNFIWNNIWTFKDRRITTFPGFISKLFQFNLTSAFGVVVIQTGSIFIGTLLFGRKFYFLYYLFGTAILVLWNFTMYSKVIWKKK